MTHFFQFSVRTQIHTYLVLTATHESKNDSTSFLLFWVAEFPEPVGNFFLVRSYWSFMFFHFFLQSSDDLERLFAILSHALPFKILSLYSGFDCYTAQWAILHKFNQFLFIFSSEINSTIISFCFLLFTTGNGFFSGQIGQFARIWTHFNFGCLLYLGKRNLMKVNQKTAWDKSNFVWQKKLKHNKFTLSIFPQSNPQYTHLLKINVIICYEKQ